MQKVEERFPIESGVPDQPSQQTAAKFPVSRNREPPTGQPDQDHVATFHAIEHESDPGDDPDEVISRDDG